MKQMVTDKHIIQIYFSAKGANKYLYYAHYLGRFSGIFQNLIPNISEPHPKPFSLAGEGLYSSKFIMDFVVSNSRLSK
jgi:hypothetical protein